MITFKTIRYKNFNKTGNVFTEISLNSHKKTLIIGKNGSGKSTILDALCFVLFNKSYRDVPKPKLVNTTNKKGTLVEVEFSTKSHEYKVVRGIKPDKFEIYKNGELVDQDASARDYQNYLETDVLKWDYKTFTHVVALGTSSFVSFMKLDAAKKREFIENLLDIQFFSTMNMVAKEQLKDKKLELDEINRKMEPIKSEIRSLQFTITQLTKDNTSRIENKEVQLKDEKYNLESYLKLLEDKRTELQQFKKDDDNLTKMREKLNRLYEYQSAIKTKLHQEKDLLRFFSDNDICPTCQQHIDEEFSIKKKEETQTSFNEYYDGYEKIVEETDILNEQIKEIENNQRLYQELKNNIYSLENNVKRYEDNVKNIEEEIESLKDKNTGTKILDEHLERLELKKRELNDLEDVKTDYFDDIQYHEAIITMLKDNGIKTKIVKQYLPVINKNINKYMSDMEFYVGFNLDENFEETVKSQYRDTFVYNSFSEGEKIRINHALLFTWREVAKTKNSLNTNLLIFDEVLDSSLDNDGTDEFMKVINNLGEDVNLFIISHKNKEMVEYFDRVIEVSVEKGFSVLNEGDKQ